MTAAGTAWHWALFYEDEGQYVDGLLRFVTDALAADRPVFVAVPPANGALLRRRLNGDGDRVRIADMTALGRNPSCIIPAIRGFIDEHPDRPVSFVGEPIWAGRTPGEVAEATRHEALINAAFDGTGADVLCPYDVAGLAPGVLADAFRTHPELVDAAGNRRPSDGYDEPRAVWQDVAHLPTPPADAVRLVVRPDDLRRLRERIGSLAAAVGLPQRRADDLLIAVIELATNSIRHGGGVSDVTAWAEPDRVVCEVRDAGVVDDPMAGRRTPPTDVAGGRGLWLVNHLCDLAQLHSSAAGTTVRITVGGG